MAKGRPKKGDRKMTGAERTRRWREKRTKNSTQAIPPPPQPDAIPDRISGDNVEQFCQRTLDKLSSKSRLKMPLREHRDEFAKSVSFEYKYNYNPNVPSNFEIALKGLATWLESGDLARKEIESDLNIVDPLPEEYQGKPIIHRSKPGQLIRLNNLMAVIEAAQTLVEQETMKYPKDLGWVWLCSYIATRARRMWSKVDCLPMAISHNSAIPIFTAEILCFLGIKRTPAAVSEVLRGRRHSRLFSYGKENMGKGGKAIAHMANS